MCTSYKLRFVIAATSLSVARLGPASAAEPSSVGHRPADREGPDHTICVTNVDSSLTKLLRDCEDDIARIQRERDALVARKTGAFAEQKLGQYDIDLFNEEGIVFAIKRQLGIGSAGFPQSMMDHLKHKPRSDPPRDRHVHPYTVDQAGKN